MADQKLSNLKVRYAIYLSTLIVAMLLCLKNCSHYGEHHKNHFKPIGRELSVLGYFGLDFLESLHWKTPYGDGFTTPENPLAGEKNSPDINKPVSGESSRSLAFLPFSEKLKKLLLPNGGGFGGSPSSFGALSLLVDENNKDHTNTNQSKDGLAFLNPIPAVQGSPLHVGRLGGGVPRHGVPWPAIHGEHVAPMHVGHAVPGGRGRVAPLHVGFRHGVPIEVHAVRGHSAPGHIGVATRGHVTGPVGLAHTGTPGRTPTMTRPVARHVDLRHNNDNDDSIFRQAEHMVPSRGVYRQRPDRFHRPYRYPTKFEAAAGPQPWTRKDDDEPPTSGPAVLANNKITLPRKIVEEVTQKLTPPSQSSQATLSDTNDPALLKMKKQPIVELTAIGTATQGSTNATSLKGTISDPNDPNLLENRKQEFLKLTTINKVTPSSINATPGKGIGISSTSIPLVTPPPFPIPVVKKTNTTSPSPITTTTVAPQNGTGISVKNPELLGQPQIPAIKLALHAPTMAVDSKTGKGTEIPSTSIPAVLPPPFPIPVVKNTNNTTPLTGTITTIVTPQNGTGTSAKDSTLIGGFIDINKKGPHSANSGTTSSSTSSKPTVADSSSQLLVQSQVPPINQLLTTTQNSLIPENTTLVSYPHTPISVEVSPLHQKGTEVATLSTKMPPHDNNSNGKALHQEQRASLIQNSTSTIISPTPGSMTIVDSTHLPTSVGGTSTTLPEKAAHGAVTSSATLPQSDDTQGKVLNLVEPTKPSEIKATKAEEKSTSEGKAFHGITSDPKNDEFLFAKSLGNLLDVLRNAVGASTTPDQDNSGVPPVSPGKALAMDLLALDPSKANIIGSIRGHLPLLHDGFKALGNAFSKLLSISLQGTEEKSSFDDSTLQDAVKAVKTAIKNLQDASKAIQGSTEIANGCEEVVKTIKRMKSTNGFQTLSRQHQENVVSRVQALIKFFNELSEDNEIKPVPIATSHHSTRPRVQDIFPQCTSSAPEVKTPAKSVSHNAQINASNPPVLTPFEGILNRVPSLSVKQAQLLDEVTNASTRKIYEEKRKRHTWAHFGKEKKEGQKVYAKLLVEMICKAVEDLLKINSTSTEQQPLDGKNKKYATISGYNLKGLKKEDALNSPNIPKQIRTGHSKAFKLFQKQNSNNDLDQSLSMVR